MVISLLLTLVAVGSLIVSWLAVGYCWFTYYTDGDSLDGVFALIGAAFFGLLALVLMGVAW